MSAFADPDTSTMDLKAVFKVICFDGQTAAAQPMTATLGASSLCLRNARSDIADTIDLKNLYRSATTDRHLVIAVDGEESDRRLMVEKNGLRPEIWQALQLLPERRRTFSSHPLGLIVACLIFIAACLATFMVLIPAASDRLAPLVPYSFEQTLGNRLEHAVLQVGQHQVCASSVADGRLSEIAEQLKSVSGISTPISIHIIDLPVANAFALPSGRIYVSSALLARIQGMDELIAVLAHETGHVMAHHALRLSLRVGGTSAALGFLFGDFTGGAAVFAIGQALMGTANSREFEREADALSVPIMQNMGVSPGVLADVLERLQASEHSGGVLATHPVTSERLTFLRQAAQVSAPLGQTGRSTNPSPQAWNSFKLICD